MLWAAIVLPALALDGALRQRPPVTQPFALVHGQAAQCRLLAVNAAARTGGLHPGQRLSTAQIICPDLVTAPHDPRRIRTDLSLIAAWAYRYSSIVAVDAPRTVALELGRSLKLFGPWPQLAQRWHAELESMGFRHHLALALNPVAAHVLAQTADGAVAADADTLCEYLAPIPVTHAGLPKIAADALPAMGIRTLGQLLALPHAALQRRFGGALTTALDRLTGALPHTLAPYQPPPSFDAEVELPAAISRHTALWFPLHRLLTDLAAYVTTRDGGVQAFTLHFGHEDGTRTDVKIGLLSPERDSQALFELAKLRLDQTRLSAPVISLGVHAHDLPPLVPPGHDLFDPRSAQALPWERLRERLRARLGSDAVYTLAVDPDPRPERGTCVAPAVAHGPPQSSPWPRRPTWLLPRPQLLRGPTPRVLAGPERLETGWWDGDDVRRDYYVVELASGQRAWVFCALGEHGPFMLHGWFA